MINRELPTLPEGFEWHYNERAIFARDAETFQTIFSFFPAIADKFDEWDDYGEQALSQIEKHIKEDREAWQDAVRDANNRKDH